MSVWCDPIFDYGWRLGPSCHMFADTLVELHLMAAEIGLKREWFQNKPRLPHYDLTVSKRLQAIARGALGCDFYEVRKRLEQYRKEHPRRHRLKPEYR